MQWIQRDFTNICRKFSHFDCSNRDNGVQEATEVDASSIIRYFDADDDG